jgi:putative Holliday junction resolvase
VTSSHHPALGIDYGKARIGIAATDDFGILAHPVDTIPSENPIPRISKIISQRKIKTLVIGIPIRLDGTEGDSAKSVRIFAAILQNSFPELPISFIDESFTTSDASEKLHQTGRNARKQKSIIDQAAAVEILNRWMQLIP